MDDLELFLTGRSNNAWIYLLSYNIYVRKGYHNIADVGCIHTFDIANIHIREKLRGKGQFAVLLDHIEKALRNHTVQPEVIYIESILNTAFAQHLLKSGFRDAHAGTCDGGVSLYRRIQRN